jgi:hypothetical protein
VLLPGHAWHAVNFFPGHVGLEAARSSIEQERNACAPRSHPGADGPDSIGATSRVESENDRPIIVPRRERVGFPGATEGKWEQDMNITQIIIELTRLQNRVTLSRLPSTRATGRCDNGVGPVIQSALVAQHLAHYLDRPVLAAIS